MDYTCVPGRLSWRVCSNADGSFFAVLGKFFYADGVFLYAQDVFLQTGSFYADGPCHSPGGRNGGRRNPFPSCSVRFSLPLLTAKFFMLEGSNFYAGRRCSF